MKLRCRIHALNNMLGFHLVSPQDMTEAAEAFLFENRKLENNIQDHLAPAGDYLIEVLNMVLRTKAMQEYRQLCWEMSDRRAMMLRDLNNCVGAVVNLRGRHWVALRRVEDEFIYLDSLSRDPLVSPHLCCKTNLREVSRTDPLPTARDSTARLRRRKILAIDEGRRRQLLQSLRSIHAATHQTLNQCVGQNSPVCH